jgi:hypothetical protein
MMQSFILLSRKRFGGEGNMEATKFISGVVPVLTAPSSVLRCDILARKIAI